MADLINKVKTKDGAEYDINDTRLDFNSEDAGKVLQITEEGTATPIQLEDVVIPLIPTPEVEFTKQEKTKLSLLINTTANNGAINVKSIDGDYVSKVAAKNNSIDIHDARIPYSNQQGKFLTDRFTWEEDKSALVNDRLNGAYIETSAQQLSYEKINKVNLTDNKTFSLATAPANCIPEYKAVITNTGEGNITVYFSGVDKIKTNDNELVVSQSTGSCSVILPAGCELEVNIVNKHAILYNWNI